MELHPGGMPATWCEAQRDTMYGSVLRPLQGRNRIARAETRGVASLSPRLIAATPSGVESTRAPAAEKRAGAPYAESVSQRSPVLAGEAGLPWVGVAWEPSTLKGLRKTSHRTEAALSQGIVPGQI